MTGEKEHITEEKEHTTEELQDVIYTLEDLQRMFPFGKSKLLKLCRAGLMPVIQVGRHYLSSPELINQWMLENVGKKIL